MFVVNDGVLGWIRTLERYLSTGSSSKEGSDHCKSLLVVARDVHIGLWAVAFRVPEFNMWLSVCEAHRVPTLGPLSFLPNFGVAESIVQSGECESAEWELREESSMVLLILRERIFLCAVMPYQMISGQLGLRGLVEY